MEPTGDEPLLIGVRLDATASARTLVTQCDDALQATVIGLFPAWLPGADSVDGTAGLDRTAAGSLAGRLGRSTPDYAPYLREVTSAALGRRRVGGGLALEQRIRGAVRVVSRTYERVPVIVLVSTATGDDDRGVAALSDAAAWIAAHGQTAVWVDVTGIDGLERFPLVELSTPTDGPVPDPDTPAERVLIPPVSGLPAPNSPAEQTLERHLATQGWAVGRRWNTLVDGGSPLDPRMRVDLVWPDARVVVEVDGPDHRSTAKYAADRGRDNLLQRRGFIVLRFTNEQVVDDVATVATQVRQALEERDTPVQFPRESGPGGERTIDK